MVTSCSYGLSYLSASTNSRCSSFATLRSATAYHLHQTPWRVLCEKAEATFDRLLLVIWCVVDKTELVIRILKKFEPDDSLIHTFVKNSSRTARRS